MRKCSKVTELFITNLCMIKVCDTSRDPFVCYLVCSTNGNSPSVRSPLLLYLLSPVTRHPLLRVPRPTGRFLPSSSNFLFLRGTDLGFPLSLNGPPVSTPRLRSVSFFSHTRYCTHTFLHRVRPRTGTEIYRPRVPRTPSFVLFTSFCIDYQDRVPRKTSFDFSYNSPNLFYLLHLS